MKNPILISSLLFLAGAVILSGTIVWSVNQLRASNSYTAPASSANPEPVDTAAIQKAEQAAASIPNVPGDMRPVLGTVTAADKNSLSIQSSDGRLLKVELDAKTELYKMGPPKDPQVYQKEVSDFTSLMKSIPDKGVVYLGPDANTHIPLTSPNGFPAGSTVVVMPSSVSGDTVHAVRVTLMLAQ